VHADRPYEGIRVVDLSQGVAGPYCAMLLARHGADVVKVEPLEGDWARVLGRVYGDHTAFSVPANLGKRSIALDLKADGGRAIVEKLLPTADVFIEGFRPGVIDRLGFSYDRLKALNPGLIYVSVSGFGQKGPLREKPAMDPVLQAFTGFMMENKGPDGVPHRTPTIIVDMSTALYAHQAVAAALYGKARHGRGTFIDVSLMQAAANLQCIRLMSAYRDGPPKLVGAPSGTFETAEGWIQIAVVKEHEFQGVCKVLGLEAIRTDPRFQSYQARAEHADWINGEARKVFATKPARYWRDLLTEAGLQNEILQTYQEFVDHPHTRATGLISFITQAGSDEPWAIANPPGMPPLVPGDPAAVSPRNGQHTREVLAGLGYGQSEIDDLVERRVVGV
jgi:crotonobetainyl-CoA:carnitine CoA-transferase CaiB-like acyl-CoA transferase